MQKKIVLLGSGELGKEVVIALQRLGQHVVAVDSYPNAPAMQVADESEVINMLDGDALDAVVTKHADRASRERWVFNLSREDMKIHGFFTGTFARAGFARFHSLLLQAFCDFTRFRCPKAKSD